MTVNELIEALQFLDDKEAYVVTSGYEGGLEDVKGINAIKIKMNVNTEWYLGPHKELDFIESDDTSISAYRLY
jgi:hypothetical protein